MLQRYGATSEETRSVRWDCDLQSTVFTTCTVVATSEETSQ